MITQFNRHAFIQSLKSDKAPATASLRPSGTVPPLSASLKNMKDVKKETVVHDSHPVDVTEKKKESAKKKRKRVPKDYIVFKAD
jgi:hypothetical protein